MPKVNDTPVKLRPYVSLGLQPKVRGKEAQADCPFCLKEGKFSINVETGMWRCFYCNTGGEASSGGYKGGNVYTFLRFLWEQAASREDSQLHDLCADRGLVYPSSASEWGVVRSPITGEWLVPGYAADGKMNTLYRYTMDYQSKKMKLYATAELGHHLLGPDGLKDLPHTTYLCEGAWDGMVLYEALRFTKKDVEGYSLTGAIPHSLGAKASVVAVPSSSLFKEEWLPLFAGKKVILCYDNDHPRTNPRTGESIPPPALEGMKRAALALASCVEHHPESIHWLAWGPAGYNESLPDGFDVRDLITAETHPRDRVNKVWWLLEKTEPIPAEWVGGRTQQAKEDGGVALSLLPCQDYKTLVTAMSKPLEFHEGLDRAFSIMLAVVLSTQADGDQLWGTFIGPPACGKSTLCEALSTAVRWVTAKSTIRGFHSGYKSDASGKEDNSLIPLIADKTLVTKDGDTLMTSPNLAQILAEARDLYDRTSRTHYRHGLKRDYEGINVTWILCGTGALSDIDTSELGQRFIKVVIMDRIDDDKEWYILLRKARQADRAMDNESGKRGSGQDPDLTRAYQLTGGYVEYLRSNANALLKEVQLTDEVYEECATLARFVAFMRARPSKKQKERAEREFATRLTSQFVRLAKCLCVVMNHTRPTVEIMRRVRQTALDTAGGRVLKLTELLYEWGTKGGDPRALAYTLGELEQDLKELLVFLKKIGAVELFKQRVAPNVEGEPRWRLSTRLIQLYETIYGAGEEERRAAAYEQDE